jgi:F0F1-type ATP synthase alpha subunit
MTELLKQGLYHPMHVTDQVMVIFAGTQGYLDKIPVARIGEWEKTFLDFVHASKEDYWRKLTDEGDMTEELADELAVIVKEFNKIFTSKKTD